MAGGRRSSRLVAAAALTLCSTAMVTAQGRTDVVSLANGDRITGEVIRLSRGRLEFKTDDAGTLYLEWDNLVSVVAARLVEVVTTDGRTFVGTLGAGGRRSIAVVNADGTTPLPMPEVTSLNSIGRSFWRKLDGSIDAGFSYTKSSGIAQLNVNSDTKYRRPGFQGRLTASLTQTERSDDSGNDDRGAVEASYWRYPWRRWSITAAGRIESNESLGLELRSQIGAAIGPRLVNSNRAQLFVAGGLAVNDERGVDVEPTQNVEALLLFYFSFYTYDWPRTNCDVSTQYYPSLSNFGRRRLQIDVSVKREFWRDFFVAMSLYDTFDSRPPNPDADRNDIGVAASIGWSY